VYVLLTVGAHQATRALLFHVCDPGNGVLISTTLVTIVKLRAPSYDYAASQNR